MFLLPPTENEKFIQFDSEDAKLNMLELWGLITTSQKEKKTFRAFKYYENKKSSPLVCDVGGYIPYTTSTPEAIALGNMMTAVISIDGQYHKIMPMHLKEMQKGTYTKEKDTPELDE